MIVNAESRKPDPYLIVRIAGGNGVWDGTHWRSAMSDSFPIIQWDVTWWELLPGEQRYMSQVSQEPRQ